MVETFLPAAVEHRERHLEVRAVHADAVVLIASDTDPVAGMVTGQHIELRDGEPVRLRPWRLRLTTPGELDRWAGGRRAPPGRACGTTGRAPSSGRRRGRRADRGLPGAAHPSLSGWTLAHCVAIATRRRSWSHSSAVPAA